jgi:hypothetical protein
MNKTYVSDVSLSPAENGVILSWNERTETKKSGDEYSNCRHEYRKMVFDGDDDATDKKESAFEKALPKFKELWSQQTPSRY